VVTVIRKDASGKPIGHLVCETPEELRAHIRVLEAQLAQQARTIRDLRNAVLVDDRRVEDEAA
jgi:hypothetical protein